MIYEIDKLGKKKPNRLQSSTLKTEGWKEEQLQEYLFSHLEDLVGPELFVIGQSKKWKEQPDLVALDKFGDLWIFELKAITGYSENLVQVLRYSQIYGAFSVDELDEIYRSHLPTPDSLVTDFCKNFAYTSPSAVAEWAPKIAQKHHLVVVVNGADEDTLAAIAHWQNQGLDIRAWLYEVYPGDAKTFRIDLPELYHRGVRISSDATQVFLVNTDRHFNPLSEPYMLQHQRALATSPGWMGQINRLRTGSKVLLYRSGHGIIAGGIATAEKKNEVLGAKPIRYVQLKEFFQLQQPLRPGEIKSLFGKGLPLRRTISAISDAIAAQVWNEALNRK